MAGFEDSRQDIFVRGYHTFMGLNLKVAPGVLIPREETELLGHTAAAQIDATAATTIIDMCTGAGNLACALAMKCPNARVWAADVTPDCVQLARANRDLLQLSERLQVVQSNMFEALRDAGLLNAAHLVVCNPPYISSRTLDTERKELLAGEPREAFDGGAYGVSIFQRLIQEAPAFLQDGGVLCFEFGVGQHKMVDRLLQNSGAYDRRWFVANSSGVPRVAVARKKPS